MEATTPAKPLGLGSTEGLGAGTEACYLASEQRPRNGGPRFCPSSDGRTISDEDFIFDALIRVGGDFGSDALRLRYAQWMCDSLNAADKTLPREPRAPNDEAARVTTARAERTK